MATAREIDILKVLFEDTYAFLIESLRTEGIFDDQDLAIELSEILLDERDIYLIKPLRSFEWAITHLQGRHAKALSRVGLVGRTLDYKVNLANIYLSRELTSSQLKKTLDVLITIFESLQKAFGLTIEPFIEALKIAKGLL